MGLPPSRRSGLATAAACLLLAAAAALPLAVSGGLTWDRQRTPGERSLPHSPAAATSESARLGEGPQLLRLRLPSRGLLGRQMAGSAGVGGDQGGEGGGERQGDGGEQSAASSEQEAGSGEGGTEGEAEYDKQPPAPPPVPAVVALAVASATAVDAAAWANGGAAAIAAAVGSGVQPPPGTNAQQRMAEILEAGQKLRASHAYSPSAAPPGTCPHRTWVQPGAIPPPASPSDLPSGFTTDREPFKGGLKWLAAANVRRRAQAHRGNAARLREALSRHSKGDNLTVVFLGGSITAGQGAVDGHSYPTWFKLIVEQVLPERVSVINGGVPGTVSSYMSVCHNMHMPLEADIVFVEYTINDLDTAPNEPVMDNSIRRPFERLIRKLLLYPRRPAVVLLHAYAWHKAWPFSGAYWVSSEREFHEFATYYRLPELSVKAAAWRLMHAGEEGFRVDRTRSHRGRADPEVDHELKGRVFYWDPIHPDGNTGHRFMGEIAAQLVLDAAADVDSAPATTDDQWQAVAPLPPPLLNGNWESASDQCFIGPKFLNAVVRKEGFEWRNEGKSRDRPKWGFIGTAPGSVLTLRVNSTSASGAQDAKVVLELAYLRSYESMGQAAVECASGCQCEASTLEGHHGERNSQVFLHELRVSQADECVVSITVLGTTKSGKNKVKVTGVMVSEEATAQGVRNHGAVEVVSQLTAAAAHGTYTVPLVR